MTPLPVRRSDVRLHPDPRRVVVKPFLPGGRNPDDGRGRVEHILDRVLAMAPEDVGPTLADVRERFAGRHGDDLAAVLATGYAAIAPLLEGRPALDADIRALVGAYFVSEYAIESAALTNPSMVPAPDQAGVPAGSLRVVVSLRAIGEGHLSSIEFRTGLVDADGEVRLETPLAPLLGERRSPLFEGALFAAKLHEVGAVDEAPAILSGLGEHFSMAELETALSAISRSDPSPATQHAVQTIHWLAASNYELVFEPSSDVSQRVLHPAGPAESRGMEDARFVRFQLPDGTVTHYATYTAYDGFNILPQLVETVDFETFRVATVNGPAARNKGMALFPRQVGGRFAALGRADNENTYLMYSDHVRFWHDMARIQVPSRPWELVQIGNCGAPIETSEGWLVVTHGVGPLRTYSLGAVLLDLEDPRQVIGHLRDPLLTPDEDERDGYVPNVVYSCGSLVHGRHLVLAYGASDASTRFASVPLDALLGELTRPAASTPSTVA